MSVCRQCCLHWLFVTAMLTWALMVTVGPNKIIRCFAESAIMTSCLTYFALGTKIWTWTHRRTQEKFKAIFIHL